jgi:aspartate carbamoyltransferase catalytic subunit
LKLARRMNPKGPPQLLRGKRIVLLFYEPSTRTRTSFEFAAKALGATTTLITATSSSIEKGESLIDTGWTITLLGADVIVMRHPNSGAPYLLSRFVPVPIVNAGDGLHQHPSQALVDALTITNHKKKLKGLHVVIVGDVFHSRVARSNALLLSKFGAKVIFCGPPDLVPDIAATIAPGVIACHDLDAALHGADVVMSLRIQKERLSGKQIGLEDYIAKFQITPQRMKLTKPDAIVMHPGPIVRGLELANEVADGPQSCVHEQVANGVKTRMAILATVIKGAR